MLSQFTIAEIPKPLDRQLAAEIADFTLLNLRGDKTDTFQDKELELEFMEDGITVAGFTNRGEIMASGLLVPDTAHKTGDLRSIATAPEYRGLGVGRTVLEILEERARQQGLVRVELFALVGSERFYWRQGYRTDDGENYSKAL